MPLLEDKDDEVRAQAMKALGEAQRRRARTTGSSACSRDANPRVQYFAAMNVGRYEKSTRCRPLLSLLAENDNKDKYLRHAGVMGLTLHRRPRVRCRGGEARIAGGADGRAAGDASAADAGDRRVS